MATEKEPEKAPETSSTSKSVADAEVFQLEALSLNYLRSQNISAIPDDDHIPKLHPCKLCNKAIFGFNLEAFTVLNCRHIYHRICLEIHIIRGATKYPTCPTCKTDIEIFREELALASGECGVLPNSPDKGIASQQSNVTIVDDGGGLGEMMALGLIVDDESSEKTKQVSREDRGTSPIVTISVTTQEQATSPISNEKGNLVQVNLSDQSTSRTAGENNDTDCAQTRASRQTSPKIIREQDKLQELLRELSTPDKGDSSKSKDEEETEGSISHSLARLYQKAMKAGLRPRKQTKKKFYVGISMLKGVKIE